MPGCGAFSLSLVDADSLDALSEHSGNAPFTSYVKAVGGGEFFVVVRCEMRISIKCLIEVDGKDIGYSWITHKPDTSPPLGPLKTGQSTSGGTENLVTHAFRFAMQNGSRNGVVKATWYTCEQEGGEIMQLDEWKTDETNKTAVTGAMPGSLPKVLTTSWKVLDEMACLQIHYTNDEEKLDTKSLSPKRAREEDEVESMNASSGCT